VENCNHLSFVNLESPFDACARPSKVDITLLFFTQLNLEANRCVCRVADS